MGKSSHAAGRSQADPTNFSDAHIQTLLVSYETSESVPSVVLTVGDDKLVFNCGQNFQRCCGDGQVRVTRLRGILLTQTSFQTSSGVPGTVITCAEAAQHSGGALTVVGPPKLGLFMNALAAYSDYVLQKLELNVRELKVVDKEALISHLLWPAPVFQSPRLTVKAILLWPKQSCAEGIEPPAKRHKALPTGHEHRLLATDRVQSADIGRSLGASADDLDGDSKTGPSMAQSSCSPAVRSAASSLGWRDPLEPAVMYICELPGKRGRFLADEAKKLGVKPGPDFGKLTRGEEVTLANGQVIRPEACMEAGLLGEVVAVVDCPSLDYLPALNDALRDICAALRSEDECRMRAVVHLSSAAVVESKSYKAWQGALPPSQHLFCCRTFDPSEDPPSLWSAHRLQAKMHILCPYACKLPHAVHNPTPVPRLHEVLSMVGKSLDLSAPPMPPGTSSASSPDGAPTAGRLAIGPPVEAQVCGERQMRHQERLVLRPLPKRGFTCSDVRPVLTMRDIMAELCSEAPEAAKSACGQLAGLGEPSLDGPPRRLRIVFLGTGAACPSKYRNVTAMYLDFGHRGGMLVDCGEGTLGQLERYYGRAGADARLASLRCVWISHRHADHHVGLPSLLLARARCLSSDAPEIPVFGPFPLRRVLSACSKVEGLCHVWVDQYALCAKDHVAGHDLNWFWEKATQNPAARPCIESVCKALDLKSMQSILVRHCKHAFGLVLESTEGWKVVISGDTQPCDAVVAAARGATLLVHEATFENDKADDAAYKKHSTIGDALQVAKEAECRSVILTHFSQRYPKVPVLGDVCQGFAGVAFDLMSVDIDHLSLPASMLAPVSKFLTADAVIENANDW